MKAPLVFAPVTRWVLAWPDGATLRIYSRDGLDLGPDLFATLECAADNASLLTAGARPVKVRVTIEVAK